jgi:glycosyltransferase involved in cell wall biosynthesis
MDPVISVIVPCYNHGLYVREAVESVKSSAGKYSFEIIIINDGSTDEYTIKVLNELKEEGYCVVNQKNQGLGATRNNGIRKSKGKYILPLDADNKICAPYMTTAIDILENQPDVKVVYSDYLWFGEKNQRWTDRDYNLQQLMLGNCIDACAVYRKSLWEELSGYDEKMPVMGYEDWDFWLRTSFKGYKFCYLREVGFEYRVLNSSMINSVSFRQYGVVLEYMWKKHKDYLGIQHVNNKLIEGLKFRKRLLIKLSLAVLAPWLLDFLHKIGLIKSKKFI